MKIYVLAIPQTPLSLERLDYRMKGNDGYWSMSGYASKEQIKVWGFKNDVIKEELILITEDGYLIPDTYESDVSTLVFWREVSKAHPDIQFTIGEEKSNQVIVSTFKSGKIIEQDKSRDKKQILNEYGLIY